MTDYLKLSYDCFHSTSFESVRRFSLQLTVPCLTFCSLFTMCPGATYCILSYVLLCLHHVPWRYRQLFTETLGYLYLYQTALRHYQEDCSRHNQHGVCHWVLRNISWDKRHLLQVAENITRTKCCVKAAHSATLNAIWARVFTCVCTCAYACGTYRKKGAKENS
jgi:hypothetical protein